VAAWIGQRRRQRLMPQGADDDRTATGLVAWALNGVNQTIEIQLELSQTGLPHNELAMP